MSKVTNENKEVIEKNLEYIGLDLNKIPKFLTKFEPLNYRTSRSYDDTIYKVYKYISIKDIEILITPTDRLTDLKQKYKLASPIFTYLDSESEQNIEKFAMFLKMVSTMDFGKIEMIEEEQNKLKEKIPYQVKYPNHFIWQIYYSDYAQKYFMLVPTNEQDNNALFYLLKKQIAHMRRRKKETIFVPITHMEYSGKYLTKSEIADIENYLWYFTKEWPSVYEVYDEKDNMSIRIVGQTNVYEKVKSDYSIVLNDKEKSIEFYKLLKAMFILSTGVPEQYQFTTKISEEGSLDFFDNEVQLTYKTLVEYINSEYLDKIEKLEKEIVEKKKLEKRLNRFKEIVEELNQEYLAKQRQIATFLECKRTFFGRVKYFLKKKKEEPEKKKMQSIRDKEEYQNQEKIKDLYEEKEQYTIEDLIDICSKLEAEVKENTNLNLDIHAIESKKDMLTRKIDNAELYIKEIDKHKKSIFEFWKFTSKDEVQTLNEGEEDPEDKKGKITKFFNYETDIEDLGKIVDELQRRKLSKNETDAIFAAQLVTDSMQVLFERKKQEGKIDEKKKEKHLQILEKELKRLKEEYKSNLEYINIKDYDIFGGLSEDHTKIKQINNQKHREIEKDKYKVLNINLETDLDVYQDTLQHYLNLILEAFHKIQTSYNMCVYKVNNKKGIDGINVFDINPEKALEEALNSKKENIILCRINLKENMPILFYSNITLYDNFNKTLPVGMDLSSEILLNIDELNVKCIKEEEFYINHNIDGFSFSTKKVKVYEYDTNEKVILDRESN